METSKREKVYLDSMKPVDEVINAYFFSDILFNGMSAEEVSALNETAEVNGVPSAILSAYEFGFARGVQHCQETK